MPIAGAAEGDRCRAIAASSPWRRIRRREADAVELSRAGAEQDAGPLVVGRAQAEAAARALQQLVERALVDDPPRRMIATRLQSSSTSASTWLDSRIVMPSAASRRDERAHVAHAGGVEAGRRLVEQQELRVAQQRGRDAEPLLHAVRVAADAILAAVGELDQLEHLLDAAARRAAVEIGEQPQVAPAREVGIEARPFDEARHAVERPRAVDERVAAEEPTPPLDSDGSARAASAATWSFPRRSGRDSRTRRRARRSGRRCRPRRARRSA